MSNVASRLPGAEAPWAGHGPARRGRIGLASNQQRELILVVDDDASIRSTVEDILVIEGYDVETASGGASAITQIRSRRPALVLLDMRMHGVDGWTVAREVRSFAPEVPIVVMTAAEDAARWAQEIGANGYLAKPFLLDELVTCVRRFIRRTSRDN